MTQPSVLLDNIASVLVTELGSAVAANAVQVVDGEYGTDEKLLKSFVTIPTPGVLVTMLGFSLVENSMKPLLAKGHFVAFCLAKLPKKPEKDSRGDVAADLASVVFLTAYEQLWNSKASKRAEKLRVFNLHGDELAEQGVSIWAVHWLQDFEVTKETVAAALNKLRKIRITFEMGDANTEDEEAQVDLSAGSP